MVGILCQYDGFWVGTWKKLKSPFMITCAGVQAGGAATDRLQPGGAPHPGLEDTHPGHLGNTTYQKNKEKLSLKRHKIESAAEKQTEKKRSIRGVGPEKKIDYL